MTALFSYLFLFFTIIICLFILFLFVLFICLLFLPEMSPFEYFLSRKVFDLVSNKNNVKNGDIKHKQYESRAHITVSWKNTYILRYFQFTSNISNQANIKVKEAREE